MSGPGGAEVVVPAQEPESAALDRAQEWRRLDRRMLLVHPVQELVKFLPVLVGVFLLGNQAGDQPWHVIGVAVPVLWGISRFFTTRYRITRSQIELRHGMVSKRVLTTPLDRVRTVELTSTPIHRVLGLARVQIGTGSAVKSGEEELRLDSLAIGEARTLRRALLHRVGAGHEGVGADPAPDEVLLRFEPAWLRYAPLTTSGVVIAAAGLGFGSQYGDRIYRRFGGAALGDLSHSSLWLLVPVGALALVVLISLLSIVGYLSTNWGFRLSTDAARRNLHVTRGLFTTKETTLEGARVRGLELREPLGLRLVGAARLAAVVTGMDRRSGGASPLVPAAPRPLVEAVGAAVLGEEGPLRQPLTGHGSQARRRRYTRAVGASLLVVTALAGLVGYAGWWPGVLVLAVLLPPAAAALARDRADRLGHGLAEQHLIVRSGTFRGRRDMLQRDGIIGWNLRSSFFQRRAGLVHLTATTAAGAQGYTAYDIPEAEAVALADAAVPELLSAFVQRRA